MTTKDLKEIFDLVEDEDGTFAPTEQPLLEDKTEPKEPSTLEDDFEYSKDLIRNLVETSVHAIEELTDLAKESEHPAAYKALSEAIANSANLGKTLMELHKTKKDVKSSPIEKKSVQNITNNTLAACSTNDLLKMIEKVKTK